MFTNALVYYNKAEMKKNGKGKKLQIKIVD